MSAGDWRAEITRQIRARGVLCGVLHAGCMDSLDGVVLEVISPGGTTSPRDNDVGSDAESVEQKFRKLSLAKNILTLASDEQNTPTSAPAGRKPLDEIEAGWTTEDVLRQRRQYGYNEIVTKKPSKLKRVFKVPSFTSFALCMNSDLPR